MVLHEIDQMSTTSELEPLPLTDVQLTEIPFTGIPEKDTKKRIEQLETEYATLRTIVAEREILIESLSENKEKLESSNIKQCEKLFKKTIELAKVTEAHKQAIRNLKGSLKDSIKHGLCKRPTVREVDKRVAETKRQHLESEAETAKNELKKVKKEIFEVKVKAHHQLNKVRQDHNEAQHKFNSARKSLWKSEKKLVKMQEKLDEVHHKVTTTYGGSVRNFIGHKLGLDRQNSEEYKRKRLTIAKRRLDHTEQCLKQQQKKIEQELQSLEQEREIQAEKIAKGEECCVVCMDEEVNVDITFLPCGHNICCNKCSNTLNICPSCRLPIGSKIKTFH